MPFGYLFYTSQGHTVSPSGKDLESMQILGLEHGQCIEEATNRLIKNNPWILDAGFDLAAIEYQAVIDVK